VKHTVADGRIIVPDGQLTTIGVPVRLERHNRLARRRVADRPCLHRALGAGSYHHVHDAASGRKIPACRGCTQH
jgi:uncharacterized metal-binding protein